MSFKRYEITSAKVAIIGLGYVGLPLAVAFSQKVNVIGYDISEQRISDLEDGHDVTLEVGPEELKQADKMRFTNNSDDLADCNIFIVTVPTPITKEKKPNLTPLLRATEMVAELLKPNDIVIYESTVYPGCTEDDCVPILQNKSGLIYNEDFFCGYSPERINPGDKLHRIWDIVKVTSGSTEQVADFIDDFYNMIITAGTFKADSIIVAEAAKIIENTQRDVNIALINELSQLFSKMDINTSAVLAAARTKWNFLNFTPGLVGGHCIGVDPYYLTHKAKQIGYNPRMILAGREINDSMGAYVADRLLCALQSRPSSVQMPKILILGLTFKENCPDIRNTKIIDIIEALEQAGCEVDIHDPWVEASHVTPDLQHKMKQTPMQGVYDGVIIAVQHQVFINNQDKIQKYKKADGVIFDIKSVLPASVSDIQL